MSKPETKRLLKEAADIYLQLRQDPDDKIAIAARDAFLARGDAEVRAWAQIHDAWSMTGKPPKPNRLLPIVLVASLLLTAFFARTPIEVFIRADYVSDDVPASIELASGDFVTIDAGSAVVDETDGGVRRLELMRGSSFFTVAQSGRPFVVEAQDVTIEVLGTEFEVALFDDGVTVAVKEGRVLVRYPAGTREIGPGDALRWSQTEVVLTEVERQDVASWQVDRLVADGITFSHVAQILDRRLPGRVVVANSALSERLVTGTFDLARPLISLRNLAATQGARVVSIPGLGNLIVVRN